jgi:hypothetical protein
MEGSRASRGGPPLPENPTVIAANRFDTLLDQPPPPKATRRRHRTPAQAEASRRNGAKSRGPRTAGGKARSCRNAVRHGLFAVTLRPTPGQDYTHSDYDELLKGLTDEHRPATQTEAVLVEALASELLHLRRVLRWRDEAFRAEPAGRAPIGDNGDSPWAAADEVARWDRLVRASAAGHRLDVPGHLLADTCQAVTEVAEGLRRASRDGDGRMNDCNEPAGVQSPVDGGTAADADSEDDLDGHAAALRFMAQQRAEERAWAAYQAAVEQAERAEVYRRVDPAELGVFDPEILQDVLSGRRKIPKGQRGRWAELLEEVRACDERRMERLEAEREQADRRQAAAIKGLLQGGSAGLETACRLEASARRSVQRTLDMLWDCQRRRRGYGTAAEAD